MRPGTVTSGLINIVRALAVLGAIGATTSACGDEDKQGKCTSDGQCEFGLVCANEICEALPCNGIGDCTNGDQACVTVNGGQFCAAVECGCPNCDVCPVGEVCSNGICGGAAACSDTVPCGGTDICDNGSCRPCQGAECATDCRTSGCEGGLTCNQQTGVCEGGTPAATPCSSCTNSAACGEGWSCVPLLTGNACLPPCQNADTCPDGWACENQKCTPASYRCEGCSLTGCEGNLVCNTTTNQCEAPPTGCTPECSGATPHCSNGTCVQCTTNTHCAQGQTCSAAGICEGTASCQAPTPYPSGNTCVECLTNEHCGGRFCDQTSKTCSDDPCAACADPYPACITYEGQQYCVQCSTDAECVEARGEGSTCNLSTYACEGGVALPSARCETNADCDAGASGFNLLCHPTAKVCYDQGGLCDDVTAFCPGSDNQVRPCLSLLEAFGGGAGGELPDLGMGGATIPGFCSCQDLSGLGLGIPSTCLGGGLCLNLGAILDLLGGGTGGGSQSGSFCFSLSL
jgi:Cys-rich repeat protein